VPLDKAGKPFTAIRRVGSPWLDAWLEKQTGSATKRSMPLFGIFLMTLLVIWSIAPGVPCWLLF
jgi:hypothetical protein